METLDEAPLEDSATEESTPSVDSTQDSAAAAAIKRQLGEPPEDQRLGPSPRRASLATRLWASRQKSNPIAAGDAPDVWVDEAEWNGAGAAILALRGGPGHANKAASASPPSPGGVPEMGLAELDAAIELVAPAEDELSPLHIASLNVAQDEDSKQAAEQEDPVGLDPEAYERAMQIFSQIDSNGNGVITLDEWRQFQCTPGAVGQMQPDPEWKVFRRLFFFHLLLEVGLWSNRGWTFLGLPSDGQNNLNAFDLADDVTSLLLYALLLALATGIHRRERVEYLLNDYKWIWAPVLMLGAGPAYSQLSHWEIASLSLSDGNAGGDVSAGTIALYAGSGVLVLAAVVWHGWFAVSRFGWGLDGLAGYLAVRILVGMVWGLSILLASLNDGVVHVHHWWVCWYVALYCKFDHWVSVVCLAVTVGIFLQGAGVYNVEPLWRESTCWYFSKDGTGNMYETSVSPSDPRTNYAYVSSFSCSFDSNPAHVCLDGKQSASDIKCSWAYS